MGTLGAAFALAGGCSKPDADGPPGVLPDAGPPNVVVLILDTLRADYLGCYGGDAALTPELDALAQRGVQFDRVAAQSPWTRPSIGSFLTSAYPRTLGIYDERVEVVPDRFTTLAEALKAAGYRTFGITSNPHLNALFNFQQGFDEYIDTNVVYTFMKKQQEQKLFKKSAVQAAKELYDRGLDFIKKDSGGPCYLQILVMDVHEWCRGQFALTRGGFKGMFEGQPNARYREAVRQTSVDLGFFVDTVVRQPGWDNTLFVIVSDHGEGLDSHPHVPQSRYHGRLLYESQLIVPWIMHHPRWQDGRRVPRPVRLLDLMPTLLDQLGLPPADTVQGVSVWPLTRDAQADVGLPEYFAAETELRQHNKIGLYGGAWKYIENRDGHEGVNPKELQPMGVAEDGVRTDQIDAHPETAAAMGEALAAWEQAHPKAAPQRTVDELPKDMEEQLEAIGYLGADDA